MPIACFGGGTRDGFVTQFNPTGTALVFSTFIGGSLDEFATGVALDVAGTVYVSGWTNSNNLPTVAPLQPTTGGGSEIFIAKIAIAPAGPGVTITESGGSTNVTEGGATDTYTAVLNVAPTADVTITITPGTQVTAIPATLTFTTVNWNVAQTVTVTAVDDALVEGAHTGTITHTAASADVAYNAIAIASVNANITDNDGVPPPPPTPGGGGISEGSYAGSQGLANGNGGEGTFGFGRDMRMQQPRLKGPYRDPAGTFRVFNGAHQHRAQIAEADSGLGVLGWGLMLLAVLVPAAVVYGHRRPA